MSEFEVVVDPYSVHDPHHFDEAKVEELAEKHGRVPYWANRKWRSERRGWRGIKPLKYEPDDPFYKDVLGCAPNFQLVDPELQVQDGYVQQGDVVLATIPVDIKKARDAKRVQEAARRLRGLRESQTEVEEEIKRLSRDGRSGVSPLRSRVVMSKQRESITTAQDLGKAGKPRAKKETG